MVLGIVGLVGIFLCGLTLFLSPFAWALGRNSLKEIQASQGRLGGESQARTGMVTGIVGTILLFLAVVAVILFVILIAAGSSSGGFGSRDQRLALRGLDLLASRCPRKLGRRARRPTGCSRPARAR